MRRCVPRSTLAPAMLGTLLACSSPIESASLVYDACYTVDDCVLAATLCEELTVEFGGELWGNAICTLGCGVEGPISEDCPRALIGRFGSCYPSGVAGGIDDSLICFEPCDVSENCAPGFSCLDALDLCGADAAGCPIQQNDAICVPAPY